VAESIIHKIMSTLREAEALPFVIKEGEDFPLFDARHTVAVVNQEHQLIEFKSLALLQYSSADNLLNIPLEIFAAAARIKKGQAFVLHNPQIGYSVDSRDYQPKTREVKYQEREEEFEAEIDFQEAPLVLSVETNDEKTRDFSEDQNPYLIDQVWRISAERLRMIITSSGADIVEPYQPHHFTPQLEGQMHLGMAGFNRHTRMTESFVSYIYDFYPLDFGPLAVDYNLSRTWRERQRFGFGLYVCLSPDPYSLNITSRVLIDKERLEEPVET